MHFGLGTVFSVKNCRETGKFTYIFNIHVYYFYFDSQTIHVSIRCTRMRDLPPSSFILFFFYRTRGVIFVISSLPCINTPPPPAQITTFTVVSIILFYSLIVNMFGAGLSPTPTPPQLRVNI